MHLKNILEEKKQKVLMYDPHLDLIKPKWGKSVFFIGTMHPEFARYKFPKGSVVIDPWRYIPKQKGVTVISVGAPEK